MTVLTLPVLLLADVQKVLSELTITPEDKDVSVTMKVPTLPSEYTDRLAKMGVKYLTPVKEK